ncbi:MAG: hypothetical protein ACP5N9_03370 [Candidatus Bilamarchaeum sp.]
MSVCPKCNQKFENTCSNCKSISISNDSQKETALFFLGVSALLSFGAVLISILLPSISIVSLFFFSWARKNRTYLKTSRIVFFTSLMPFFSFTIYLLVFVLPQFYKQFIQFSKYSSDSLLYAIFMVPFICGIINSVLFYFIYQASFTKKSSK